MAIHRGPVRLLSALAFCAAAAYVVAAPAQKPRTIRWLVAHDRGNTPFSALNHEFAKRLEEKSGGSLKIEFVKTDAAESRLDEAAFAAISQGKSDMSQLAASGANVHVFDLPFLFRDYAHAEAVFESPLGARL